MSKQAVETKGYKKTHIDTYRYRCKSVTYENKKGKMVTDYPVNQKGNYEPLLSFTALPPYKEFKEKGRSWKYTKHYQPVMDRILLDIDCEDLETAFDVTKKIMQDLDDVTDHINVYFSGSKGFHIEILTELLDIVDTSVDKPKDSCYQYVEFLNYFMDKYPQVDLSLKDVGTRIIRIHHTKHEKTGNFKILVNLNASLDDILTSSKADKDMVKPADRPLLSETALLLMDTYRKPIEQKVRFEDIECEVENITADDSIYTTVYNELNTHIHNKILLIGSGLNGFVDIKEAEAIYNYLAKTTDIEESTNSHDSFIEAYQNDKYPQNLGALRNHYEKYNLDQTNFDKLSYHLKSKVQLRHYDQFNDLMQLSDDDWYKLLDDHLFDYVDNTENIFKGIIHCLSSLLGYKKASRFIVVNGGAGVGKSEFVNTIEKLMPRFIDMGSSTPATIRRRSEYYFNKKIVYIGDKGLGGQTAIAKEEFKGLQEVFGGLISDHKFKRDVMIGNNDIGDFNLKSNGICVFYTEPYTNLQLFGAGDQYTDRSTYITVNPVNDGLTLILQDDDRKNEFYTIHKNYIRHLLKHPLEIKLSDDVKTALWYGSKSDLRTYKYLRDLFKAYCQYLQIGNPLTTDVKEFLKIFKPKHEVTDIEYEIYRKLYKNLNVLMDDDLDYKIADDGSIQYEDMVMQVKDRKTKSFFTARQIKTYFQQDFKRKKNLKDTLDQVPDILNNLYNAGLIERLEWQYNGQNVYYIPYNKDVD